MFFLLLLTPLISFFFVSFFGSFFGRFGSSFFCIFNMFLCFFTSFIIFIDVCFNKFFFFFKLFDWIRFDLVDVSWFFLCDPLSCVMYVVISFISLCAHLFSFDYMFHDRSLSRFMSYLSLFTFFMLFLVSSGNLLQFFFAWEGVGICSFLLINFWHSRIQASKSAIKAVIVNKFGDLFFLFALGLFFYIFKTFDIISCYNLYFFDLFNYNFYYFIFDYLFYISIYDFLLFCFFVASLTKSAQIGFHIWLPDAMEGPTPVSSLLHAATMVTAGVFLLLRFSFFFEMSSSFLFLMSFVGSFTLLLSSLIGVFQFDIKRIVAYSTCSQIGYMFLCCGFSGYSIAIFHLYNHAFFKALLFLSCGLIIHSFFNEQDFRKLGGLYKLFPFSYICFLIGSFSLLGFPFLSGFYSKDLIFEYSLYYLNITSFVFWISLLSVSLSCLYSLKLIFVIFFGSYSSSVSSIFFISSSSLWVLVPLCSLMFFSIVVGMFSFDFFCGYATDFWSDSFFHCFFVFPFSYEFHHFFIKLLPLFITFYFLFFYFIFSYYYRLFYIFIITFNSLFILFNLRFLFDFIYNFFISYYCYYIGFFYTFITLDKGFFEWFGPYGLFQLISSVVSIYRFYSYGSFYFNYFLIFFFYCFFFFYWFFFF